MKFEVRLPPVDACDWLVATDIDSLTGETVVHFTSHDKTEVIHLKDVAWSIDRKPVNSSNVVSIGYGAVSRRLHVEFKGGKVYEYQDVPESLYKALMAADSPGQHVARFLVPRYRGKPV